MIRTGTKMGTFGTLFPFTQAVHRIANHQSTTPLTNKKKDEAGRKRVNAKLTAEQVLEIARRREKGRSAAEIANHMHLSPAAVAGVIYGGNGARTLNT